MKYLSLALLILLGQTVLYAQDKVSRESLLSDEESACFTVFSSRASVASFLCNACFDDISNRVQDSDKLRLLSELNAKSCGVNEPFKEKKKSGWAIYLDQDLLALDSLTDLNSDRNYTMGLGFSQSGSDYSEGLLATTRNWLDERIEQRLFSSRQIMEVIHSREFGVTAFTPDKLEFAEPIQGDRPYASLIYFSNSKLRAYSNDTALKTKFVIGLLGLDIAKAVQRYLHNQVGVSDQDPLGWDNQISEGGEPTALYSIEKMVLWKKKKTNTGINWDISYAVGGNLGYYTDLSAGFDIRLGKIGTPYYTHSANPLSDYNHMKCQFCGGDDNYFFASYRARLVGYNVLLQGQFRNSVVTFSGSEIERLLHEAALGWAYHFKSNWKLTYSLNYKSEEYKGVESRAHWFGGLYLSKNL